MAEAGARAVSSAGSATSLLWGLAAAFVLVGAARPAAQGLPPLVERRAPDQRRLFDRVIGIFGDKAILESSIRAELDAQVRGLLGANRNPTQDEIEQMRRAILRQKLQDEALAQGARTLPGTSREQVDQIVAAYLDDYLREEEERAGSINKLTQELGILGKTLESVSEERRTEVMAQITMRQNLQRRWRDQFALAVTPTEMKRYYEEHREEFVEAASADLEVVAIPVGGDPEGAEQRARQAAAAWREGSPSRAAGELAEAFGGVALDPRRGVRNAEDDANAPPIKEFAGSAAVGEVSAPIRRGNSWWILRVVDRSAGRDDPFSSPQVQSYILDRLVRQRINEESNRLILKSRDKFRPIPARGRVR
jgi:parvulin-like peptidyl-prolyl isomerase